MGWKATDLRLAAERAGNAVLPLKWFRYFVQYLKAHLEIGWAYWALNGASRLGDPCPQ